MGHLDGKVAIVTGVAAIRSMGRGIANRLAADGANVIVVDKFACPKSIWPGDEDWKGLDAVVDEIKALGRDALAVEADVSSSDDVDALVAKSLEKFGKIDILVNCVGVRGPVPVPFYEYDEKTFKLLLDINLTGAFLISKAVVKTMLPNGEGKKIVHIASQAAIKPFPGGIAYAASKHGVLGLVKTMAMELAKFKINVNVISPGAFETNFRDAAVVKQAEEKGLSVADSMKVPLSGGPSLQGGLPPIPLGRMGYPQDVANLVSFLVSEESNYITGENFNLAGGLGLM